MQPKRGAKMEYKELFEKEWVRQGGLINKATAAKILKVNNSVLSKRKDIKKIPILQDEFVSFAEIIKRDDIKPRRKKVIREILPST
jgi:hypothetical protein